MMSSDRNNKDPSGVISYRGWLYSHDENGVRIRVPEPGGNMMRVNPTPPHALSHPDDGGREEAQAREGMRNRILAELTDLERLVLQRQGKLNCDVEDRMRIPAGDIEEFIQGGYTYVPGSEREEAREGMSAIITVEVVGSIRVQVEGVSHEEIARELGVTERQVRRAVESANRKLREMGEK